MAASVNDHIHLDTDNPPTDTYKVITQTWDPVPTVPLATDQALNGMVHVHRLVDDEGAVIRFPADRARLKELTMAQMLGLLELIGSTVYFVSNYHDDNEDLGGSLDEWPDSDYVVRGVLQIRPGEASNVDPLASLWNVTISIIDTGTVT